MLSSPRPVPHWTVRRWPSPDVGAGLIDWQSVKDADTVSGDTRGYDAGKGQRPQAVHRHQHPRPAAGRVVLTASAQDREGAKPVLLDTYVRALARDYERDSAVSEAMIRWAAINAIT